MLFPDESVESLKVMLYRWKTDGKVKTLKNGLYELCYPRDLTLPDLYIANKLYNPSYVSLQTALSIYSIIPEVSMSVTSVTTKTTRKFKNSHGSFFFRTIKPEYFAGYRITDYNGFYVFIAEPEKAVIDFLYLNNEKYRFDMDVIKELSKSKLNKYSKLMKVDLHKLC